MKCWESRYRKLVDLDSVIQEKITENLYQKISVFNLKQEILTTKTRRTF